MCLIITGASAKIRSTLLNTHGMLNDIYTSNPDGIGIMYATTKGLKVTKVLPKSIADATQFISKLPTDDRELAIHFRWTTHGHTNMENCHPYDVVKGYVGMMHNGVLHTGNAADKAKSDTWHFINDYLASPVAEHPALVHNEKFLDMIAEFIGDNRFVFMDGEGKMSHVNYDQGIEHDGLWFSNTYAWTPSRLIPAYKTSTKKSYKSYYPSMYGVGYDDARQHRVRDGVAHERPALQHEVAREHRADRGDKCAGDHGLDHELKLKGLQQALDHDAARRSERVASRPCFGAKTSARTKIALCKVTMQPPVEPSK